MPDHKPIESFLIWCAYCNPPVKPDLKSLYQRANDWITMISQKSGGEQKSSKSWEINWQEDMDRIKAETLYHGITLVTSGYMDKVDWDAPPKPFILDVPDESNDSSFTKRSDWKRSCYGLSIDPEVLKKLVNDYRGKMFDMPKNHKLSIIVETATIALSGRIENLKGAA